MPTPTTTQLNPGAGGANVAVDQQSATSPFGANAEMPISELAFSSDGNKDSLPVTGVNPLPVGGVNPATGATLSPSVVPSGGVNEQAVYDARAAAARDEMRVNIQAIVDTLTTTVLQVAAQIAGRQAGAPDPTNVVGIQGVSGGTPVASSIQSAAGSATVFPAGELRVQGEATQLFYDDFSSSVTDLANRWNSPVAVGGGTSAINTQGSIAIGTGSTVGGYAVMTSQAFFSPTSPGWLLYFANVNLEFPVSLNGYRFWGGISTQQTSPTVASPMVEGFGWEVTTAGHLCAVTYAGGSRNLIADLYGTKQPTDAIPHKYHIWFRGDLAYWAIDTIENVVATMPSGALGPNNNNGALGMLAIAGNPAPGSNLQVTFNAVYVADTTSRGASLNDGQFGWRAARVTAPNTAPATTDSALVVSLSPNSPLAVDESGAPASLPLVRGGRAQATLDRELNGQMTQVVAKLDAIMWLLMQISGQTPPANDSPYTFTQ